MFDDTVQVRIIIQHISEADRSQQIQICTRKDPSQFPENRAGQDQISEWTEADD